MISGFKKYLNRWYFVIVIGKLSRVVKLPSCIFLHHLHPSCWHWQAVAPIKTRQHKVLLSVKPQVLWKSVLPSPHCLLSTLVTKCNSLLNKRHYPHFSEISHNPWIGGARKFSLVKSQELKWKEFIRVSTSDQNTCCSYFRLTFKTFHSCSANFQLTASKVINNTQEGTGLWHYHRMVGDAGKFCCSIWDKNFTKSAYLKIHHRSHTDDKPFNCSKCNKKFRDSGKLKRHERIHTGEKPFSCSKCDNKFNNAGNLKTHERIHTKEKPFSCSKCDKTFTQRGNLKT